MIDKDTEFLIDIDGVILDTEERIDKIASKIGWKEAFRTINWHDHIYSSKQINGSLDILKEVQGTLKRIKLVTVNQCAEEAREKINYMRENGIIIPIISVPTRVSKSVVVPPIFYNNNVVLVDDQVNNVREFIAEGGMGFHFSDDDYDNGLVKVKSLSFLRKWK